MIVVSAQYNRLITAPVRVLLFTKLIAQPARTKIWQNINTSRRPAHKERVARYFECEDSMAPAVCGSGSREKKAST